MIVDPHPVPLTLGQRIAYTALGLACLAAILTVPALKAWAFFTCLPQKGDWTVLTGQVCYGEKP